MFDLELFLKILFSTSFNNIFSVHVMSKAINYHINMMVISLPMNLFSSAVVDQHSVSCLLISFAQTVGHDIRMALIYKQRLYEISFVIIFFKFI